MAKCEQKNSGICFSQLAVHFKHRDFLYDAVHVLEVMIFVLNLMSHHFLCFYNVLQYFRNLHA